MPYDEELAQRVRELLVFEPDVVERRMFGGLSFLIGGHLAVGISGSGGLLMRAEAGEQDELLSQPHVEPFVMSGRAMKGWVRVATEGVADDTDLRRWVEAGCGLARSLPPKR